MAKGRVSSDVVKSEADDLQACSPQFETFGVQAWLLLDKEPANDDTAYHGIVAVNGSDGLRHFRVTVPQYAAPSKMFAGKTNWQKVRTSASAARSARRVATYHAEFVKPTAVPELLSRVAALCDADFADPAEDLAYLMPKLRYDDKGRATLPQVEAK